MVWNASWDSCKLPTESVYCRRHMELVWPLCFINLIALLLCVLATQERALGSTRHSVFAGVRLTPRKPSESMSVRFAPSLKVEKSLAQVLISAVESSLTQGSQYTQTSVPPFPLLQVRCWGSQCKVWL